MEQLSKAQRKAVIQAVKDFAHYFDLDNKGNWIKDEKLDEWLEDLRSPRESSA